MKTILVVEDEIAISRVLKAYLQKSNFHVILEGSGTAAVDVFWQINPDLVLLDVMLPGVDGWTILKEIRKKSTCPVIMLTALDQINYRLEGLNGGADDYIAKPFIGDEVVARVKAVLRRFSHDSEEKDTLIFGNLEIALLSHRIKLNGKEIELAPRDLSLFIFLAKHRNQTFTREQLIERVWGIDYEGSDRAVDLSIKRVRNALQDWPSSEGEIRTLRGLGYQLCVHTKN